MIKCRSKKLFIDIIQTSATAEQYLLYYIRKKRQRMASEQATFEINASMKWITRQLPLGNQLMVQN